MRRGWRQPQEIQQMRKESKRTSETPPTTWLGGAQWGSLWLRNGKVRSQVSGIDQSRFPRRRTIKKVKRGGRRASKRAKERVLHQSTAASTWWCGPRPRLDWVEMVVGLPEGPSYAGHSPFVFSLCCPLNDRRRAAHSIFKIGRLFSLFLLSCPTLALLRLLILLLLLMSGNVHPNPGPIFPCSVCAGNVTWRGKSVQCCACSKWVHLRCSQISLSNFRVLGSSHFWSCPPHCRNTVTPPPQTLPTRIPPLWNLAPLC